MGTNFYLATKEKSVRDKYFGYAYDLTDEPDWYYEIHIAKTSAGWLPLFQAHDCFKSVKELEQLYKTGSFVIYDEYLQYYNWDEFVDRVVKHNGGYKGAIPRERIVQDVHSYFYDKNAPEYRPISHFEYGNGAYASDCFMDDEGYEFTWGEFS